jgi:guanine deaminase
VCGLDNQIGDFKVGKSFDALLVSVREEAGNPFVWSVRTGPSEVVGLRDKKDLLEVCLERFLFCGDDRNIRRVYVQGRLIGGKNFPIQ